MSPLSRPWRTGSHWGRTVVAEGYGPPDGQGRRARDQLIGVMDTPELARAVVDAHNRLLSDGSRR